MCDRHTISRRLRGVTSLLIPLTAACVPTPVARAGDGMLEVGVGPTQPALAAHGQPWAAGLSVGGGLRFRLDDRWSVRCGVVWRRVWDDTTSAHVVKLPDPDREATRAWTIAVLSVQVVRALGPARGLAPYAGAGLGWSTWRVEQYPGYTPVRVGNGGGRLVPFQADELVASLIGGVQPRLVDGVRLHAELGIDIFTGFGPDFKDDINRERSRLQTAFTLGLAIPLSRTSDHRPRHPRTGSPTPGFREDRLTMGRDSIRAGHVDADGDGVEDQSDQCPGTPPGAIVDRLGCPLDADGDGVFDGIDRCPSTAAADRERVDSTGCVPSGDAQQIDTSSQTPAPVAVRGDRDADGIPDSLDLCPDTPAGMEVDSSGCLQITTLDRRMILSVSYTTRGTEPDTLTKRILAELAVRLRAAPAVLVTIEAFTDSVGDAGANLRLSQRRADRARALLAGHQVAAKRISAIGHGEANPIADNATALGRRSNRRLEISFR